MALITTKYIGAFVRWLFKGCKTNLRDELDGNFNPKILGSYDLENYFIGLFTCIVLIALLVMASSC